MKALQIIQNQRAMILEIASRNGASNVRLFGSVIRGEDNDRSDIDFLVDMEPGRSLLDLAGLQLELEALLERKVDVLTEPGINEYLKDRILNEAKSL